MMVRWGSVVFRKRSDHGESRIVSPPPFRDCPSHDRADPLQRKKRYRDKKRRQREAQPERKREAQPERKREQRRKADLDRKRGERAVVKAASNATLPAAPVMPTGLW